MKKCFICTFGCVRCLVLCARCVLVCLCACVLCVVCVLLTPREDWHLAPPQRREPRAHYYYYCYYKRHHFQLSTRCPSGRRPWLPNRVSSLLIGGEDGRGFGGQSIDSDRDTICSLILIPLPPSGSRLLLQSSSLPYYFVLYMIR